MLERVDRGKGGRGPRPSLELAIDPKRIGLAELLGVSLGPSHLRPDPVTEHDPPNGGSLVQATTEDSVTVLGSFPACDGVSLHGSGCRCGTVASAYPYRSEPETL